MLTIGHEKYRIHHKETGRYAFHPVLFYYATYELEPGALDKPVLMVNKLPFPLAAAINQVRREDAANQRLLFFPILIINHNLQNLGIYSRHAPARQLTNAFDRPFHIFFD